jgi:uncharacterized membrane protein YkvA (DUF1232 family)
MSGTPPARLPVPTWLILAVVLAYVISPVDALPLCPIDDAVVAVLGGGWAAARQLRPAKGAA